MKAALIKRLRGALAAIAVLCLALTALPATAEAAYSTQTANLTISDVASGDTVTLYQISKYEYDGSHNTVSWDFTDWAKTWSEESHVSKTTYRDQTDDDTIKGYADTMAQYVAANHIVNTRSDKASGTSVTFSGLDDGSYLVVVTPGTGSTKIYQHSIVDLTPVQGEDGNWTVTAKNVSVKSSNYPTPDKNITGVEGDVTSGYKPGDNIGFTIDTTAPEYPDGSTYPYFAISDKMSDGLSFNSDIAVSASTEINGKTETRTLQLNQDYTLTPNPEGKTFEIVFNYGEGSSFPSYAGWNITVSYSAKVNDDAVVLSKNNVAAVEFSSDPNIVDGHKTSTDTVYVYNYKVNIKKVDADDKNKGLEGAKFNVKDSTGTIVGQITTDKDGNGSITGLAAGKYSLVETEAPTEYQLDSTPIEFEVNAVSEENASDDELTITLDDILNHKTPKLPITGGSGTIALTAAGVVLVAGAAALIVRTRRNNE